MRWQVLAARCVWRGRAYCSTGICSKEGLRIIAYDRHRVSKSRQASQAHYHTDNPTVLKPPFPDVKWWSSVETLCWCVCGEIGGETDNLPLETKPGLAVSDLGW